MNLDDLTPTQMEAVQRCCSFNIKDKIVAITGQAGTGKTVLLQIIADSLVAAGYNVALAAPTGKAAKRIKEATGYDASTLHRLLEYPMPGEVDPKTGKSLGFNEPRKNAFNKLEYDVVLVDEYAMVNHEVHKNLITAMPSNSVLRVFGDVNQLAPIEAKKKDQERSPFTILLEKFGGIILDVVHRQAEESGILFNGNKIIKREMVVRKSDFQLAITTQPLHKLEQVILKSLEYDINYKDLTNQVITPAKKTWTGQARLNRELQNLLNRDADRMEIPRFAWEEQFGISIGKGDKVMITKNDYAMGVFNGESGIVLDIDKDVESVTIDFGDKVIEIPNEKVVFNRYKKEVVYDPRKAIDLAFAVTTHKAQGSEYDNVIYVLNKSSSYNQSSNNFYTAITRAKKNVIVISDQASIVNSTIESRR